MFTQCRLHEWTAESLGATHAPWRPLEHPTTSPKGPSRVEGRSAGWNVHTACLWGRARWLRVLSIQGTGHAKLDTFWRGFHQRLNLHFTVRFVWRFKELRACWTVRQFKIEPDVLYILANYVMWSFHSSWSRIYNNIKIKSSWRSRSPRRP